MGIPILVTHIDLIWAQRNVSGKQMPRSTGCTTTSVYLTSLSFGDAHEHLCSIPIFSDETQRKHLFIVSVSSLNPTLVPATCWINYRAQWVSQTKTVRRISIDTFYTMSWEAYCPSKVACVLGGWDSLIALLDNKVNGAKMGPIWAPQDPGEPMLAPLTLLSGLSWVQCLALSLYFLENR